MPNSYVTCLLQAVEGVLADALVTFPSIRRELIRDRSRVSSLAEHRGLPVFTLDLPALGKHFDKCLSEGAYVKPDLPISRTIKASDAIPRLFSGLLLRVFHLDGMLRQEPCVDAIAFLRQLYALGKKVRIDCEERKVYETVQDFYTVDLALPAASLDWKDAWKEGIDCHSRSLHFRGYCERGVQLELDLHGHNRSREYTSSDESHRDDPLEDIQLGGLLDTLQLTADLVSTTLGSFDPMSYRPKHGPGAVSDQKGKSYKYDFPQWSDQLEAVFPQAEFAYANYAIWAEQGGLDSTSTPTSKLICVPKTQKGPRLIASEPVAHQWCQQVIWKFLEERVAKTWISNSLTFRDQRGNQVFAQQASKTGSHWTVDLSAASDRVSCRFVERLFRRSPDLLRALIAVRTPYISQEIDRACPKLYELRKFTTMGSACTFPVESIGFLTIALSAVLHVRKIRPTFRSLIRISKEVRVFGDDLIIPSDAGKVLEALLHHLDFKVNHAKTHRNGRFRESCGMEVYDGVDVTPSYILQLPTATRPGTIASFVECANNFHRRGWWHTASRMTEMLEGLNIPLVSHRSGSFGLVTFGSVPTPKRVRWNQNLHKWEAFVTTIRGSCTRLPVQSWSALLQYFVEAPPQTIVWGSGWSGRPRIKLRRGWEGLEP
ncbi:MAG: putative replicase protein [Hampduvirus faecihabitans]|uniref:RNA-directed RNA polymerase n=1 Tax=Leviviridae sp. TaxID=2027243 RepID=A0ABY3SVE9_9VIRU|nr:MAG: putative replicase protein [Leviviridae sp.]